MPDYNHDRRTVGRLKRNLKLLRDLIERAQPRPAEERFVFLNAWIEWAEGNHLEPDVKHGRGFSRLSGVRRRRHRSARSRWSLDEIERPGRRLEVAATPEVIGLQVVALRPLVPGVHEDEALFTLK